MDTPVKRAYDVRNTLRSAPHAMTLISEPVRAELISAYTAPDRHYHDLRHVEALLGLSDACASAITDRDAVEAAIWFHDAIYDTRRSDNEERSAALARFGLQGCLEFGLEIRPVHAVHLDWDQLAIDELAHRVAQQPDLLRQLKVHTHLPDASRLLCLARISTLESYSNAV